MKKKKQFFWITGFSFGVGECDLDTISETKSGAIKKIVASFGNTHTWKQLYKFGRRTMKIGVIK